MKALFIKLYANFIVWKETHHANRVIKRAMKKYPNAFKPWRENGKTYN